ncbi:olfactory receptor 5V1-like [Rhinatrema bivittatum]|uniref:olfactory receptor 5V1-like n=1 Tax=Rhinatrema bivittatum TaxID=194408 RepID=UPI00112ABC58|nr:olfactory receptor 5V1-like [Rhinatrema bivittatum]
MANTNLTVVTEFIMAGFDDIPAPSMFLFVLLLVIYTVTLGGNLFIFIIIRTDQHLHTPMCFFLSHLSFLDICYISATVPKMLEVLVSKQKAISYIGCALQLYFIILFESTECYLLAVMAYDRYIAISDPLRYSTIMSPRLCHQLTMFSWIVGVINAFIQTRLTFQIPFCGPNHVNHFFCDIPPLLQLSCSDTSLNELVLYAVGGVFVGLGPFLFILVSYGFILATILRMSSAKGRQKAFSTCASHVIVLTVFYGVGSFTYMRPRASYSLDRDKLVSAFYNIITPMLNPIIYSLRNGEIKSALKDALRRQVKAIKN